MKATDRLEAAVIALEAAGHLFEKAKDIPWLVQIEQRFGRPLPATARILFASFTFPEFDVGGVVFFSNVNDGSPEDITVAPFADPYLSQCLIEHSFLQFGRLDSGSYNPACLDCSVTGREPPVVSLEHEDILLERKNVHAVQIANSFIELIEAGIHSGAS